MSDAEPTEDDLDFEVYDRDAALTAIFPRIELFLDGREGSHGDLTYLGLGLVGEAGEVAEQIKKFLRDDKGTMTDARREKIIAELGDVLWYLSMLAGAVESDLEEVAETNLAKLARRAAENKLNGSGSSR